LLKRVYASIYGSIKAELTATNGTGWHRYTYSTTSNTWLMIDLSSSHAGFIDEEHQVINNQEISGSVKAFTVCKQNGGQGICGKGN
jgi:putative alpha-1,2-mannosidase